MYVRRLGGSAKSIWYSHPCIIGSANYGALGDRGPVCSFDETGASLSGLHALSSYLSQLLPITSSSRSGACHCLRHGPWLSLLNGVAESVTFQSDFA